MPTVCTVVIVGDTACGSSSAEVLDDDQIIFNEEDISALRYGRFQHPDPRVQVHGSPYLRSQGVANAEILRLWGCPKQVSIAISRHTWRAGSHS